MYGIGVYIPEDLKYALSRVAAARGESEAEVIRIAIRPSHSAELDHMLWKWYGIDIELAVLRELSSGSWELAHCDAGDLRVAHEIISRYHDQQIGLTEASLVVLAERYGTDRILTLDHRHFAVLRTRSGDPFTLLPDPVA